LINRNIGRTYCYRGREYRTSSYWPSGNEGRGDFNERTEKQIFWKQQGDNLSGREALTLGAGKCVLPLVCLKQPMRGCWSQNFSQWEHSDFVQNSNV